MSNDFCISLNALKQISDPQSKYISPLRFKFESNFPFKSSGSSANKGLISI